MGHSRIRSSIKGRPFRELTALCNHNANSSAVAGQVLQAAHDDLNYEQLKNNTGYQEAVKLLAHFGLAAQSKDFLGYLRKIGLNLPDRSSIEDIKAEAMEHIERACAGKPYTDLTEISINAIATAIQSAVDKDQNGLLWSPKSEDYLASLAKLKKAENYAALGQVFFGEVMYRALQKYVSRQVTTIVGVSERMRTVNEKRNFDRELHDYCMENAKVVKSFCVDWLGLHEHKLHDVDTALPGFATYGMEKIFKAMSFYEDKQ
ncbi:MAG: hypothetical protein PHR89_04650 [Bacilli bacterium]|nr:hypothetical protein [Bacilli bacterium]